MPALDSTDLVLLLLAAPTANERLQDAMPGITRLEKLLYLVDRETEEGKKVGERFSFKPYDFGPFSKDVYEAVRVLEAAGLLREELVYSGRDVDSVEARLAGLDEEPEGTERRFFLTPDGKVVADLLSERAPKLIEELTRIKDRYGRLPLRNLIHYVYTRYPGSAQRSKIRGQVVGE
jgi:uncharacterized protein